MAYLYFLSAFLLSLGGALPSFATGQVDGTINPAGRFQLNFPARPGESYEIQTSPDLTNWVPTFTISGSGPQEDWDDYEVAEGKKFYRVEKIATPEENLTSGTMTVNQTWPQEPQGYDRTAQVIVPAGAGPFPVLIALHGAGGSSKVINSYGYLTQMIRVAPQGYLNFWNVSSEPSQAPDVAYMRQLILQLRTYKNVDAGDIAIIGSSNGAGLVNRLLLELDGSLFQHGMRRAGNLSDNTYRDGTFWADPTGGNNRNTPTTPPRGRRIFSATGTADTTIPYGGGWVNWLGLNFTHSQDDIIIYAQAMGHTGPQIPHGEAIEVSPGVFQSSYLDGDVVHYKLIDAPHSLAPFSSGADGRLADLIKGFLSQP